MQRNHKYGKPHKMNVFYKSYIAIRRSIGYLGVLLPILLITGGLLLNGGTLEFSLSAYYHNNLGDIFVLFLGAAGMLLIAYRGGELIVRILTSLSGVLALLIILFPTYKPGIEGEYGVFKLDPLISGNIHMFCAISFFVILGIISFWRFTHHREGTPEERLKHDRWYKLLGLTIFICAAIYMFIAIFYRNAYASYPILILETIGLEAMGLTWLIKGSKSA